MKAATVSLLSHCQHTIYRGMGEEGAVLQGMGRREYCHTEEGGGEGTALHNLFND